MAFNLREINKYLSQRSHLCKIEMSVWIQRSIIHYNALVIGRRQSQ